ncbi:C4-dicarboxylate transport sensor protein DctB [Rubripirellula lacrimiformis]|uniref:histidine kinase n=1 Tax=Rubripirellula lacrimiformis TaxID=1930273 RepID=A0A517N615_9BACT|nr:HAMP domain-containing sensor histidine kinase [Rubripirellula lacrimiformis]QDT02579.1 C4-dicarboxylate transport sensor protein DctB [Rubripirellula lacrimiformis]
MGLLPCLRRGSDRWWLPRSAEATDVIGRVLLRGHHVDAKLRSDLAHTIAADPPLLIFAALGWPEESADPADLADWLIQNASGRFASGDAFIGAQAVTADTQAQWHKLRSHFRTLPIDRWMDDAATWLEVAGPKVSSAWQQQWPQITAPSNGAVPADSTASDDMLAQLARMVQRTETLEGAFDRVLHKSKLGAIKQLAYGLSHEINNPLANISTRAQQLQRGESDPARVATLQRIVDQVYRAHEMISDLMFYANPPAAIRSRCEVNGVLHRVAESFRSETDRQSIRLEVVTPDEPTAAILDENMIAEAVGVLIRNAIDAVGCQGTIVVSLVRESGQIMIHVADSGPGVSENARQHAFDPYFSGREAGRGLGLGLCRAYRVARLHLGDVTLAGGPIGCVATISLNDFSGGS